MRLLYEPLTDIPVGFTEVEYIEGTGTQYIDTGYVPSNTTGQYARMQYTTVNNGVAFGSMISGNRVVGPYYASSSSKWFCGWGGSEPSTSAATPTTSTMYDLYLNFKNDRVAKVNDIVLSDSLGDISGNYPSLTLFRRNYSSAYAYLSGKIYKYQITEGNNLVRDFVPCLDSNNVPCMYDKIGGEAYYNAGTGSFNVGRKIIPVEYLQSTGTQYINTGYAPSYNTKLEMLIDGVNDASYPEGVSWFFGSRTANQVNGFGGYYNKNEQNLYGAFGNKQLSTSLNKTLLYNKKDLIVLDNSGLYLDNTKKITFGSSTFTGTYPIFLYTVNLAGSIGYKTAFKIYYCKIFNNDVLVRDFIPCKDENGVGFMFDKVTHSAYLNAGTGDFAFGETLPKKKLRLIKESNRRVPKGFTEVEYIQSTGTQYIRSGLTMPNGFRIKGSLSIDDLSATGGVFGCYTSSSPYYRNFFDYTSAKNWLVGYGGGSYQYFGSNVVNTVYNFDICNVHGKEHLEVNGTEYAFSPSGNIGTFTDLEIPIFALNVSGTISNIAKMKLYCLKVYNENGVLVRDYLPCLDRNNVPCLFDLVENKPYYNAGSGDFSYGHTITPVEYLESTGTQYIDTKTILSSTSKVECLGEFTGKPASGSSYFFGTYGNSKNFGINTANIDETDMWYGVWYNVSRVDIPHTAFLNTKYKVIVERTRFVVNDYTYAYNGATFTGTASAYLFWANGTSQPKSIMKVYYTKIWDNDTLVRDYIPCKDENGVGYMFDKVNHTLYANAGTGSFVVGDEIEKVKTRFIMDGGRRLPKGYTEVEYLQSSGSQYIDTGYKPNNTTEYEVVGYMNPSGVFGVSRWSGEPTYDTFGAHSVSANPLDYYGRYSSDKYLNLPSSVFSKQIVWKHTSTNISVKNAIDGTSYVNQNIVTDTFQSTYNLWIFGFNNMGTILSRNVGCKINAFKIWDNGLLIRDYLPCLDRNGVPCMYDLVENKTYYNAGTGTFSYGHAITPVKYLQSSGTQYINTGINSSSTLKWQIDSQYDTYSSSYQLHGMFYSSQRFMIGVNISNYFSISYVANNTTNILNDNGRHLLEIDALNKTYSIDSIQRGTFQSDVSVSQPLYLFARRLDTSSVDGYVRGKVYGSKVWNNNTLVRDFIPVKDENNVGYLLDLVTHSLYSNAGSGSFIVG